MSVSVEQAADVKDGLFSFDRTETLVITDHWEETLVEGGLSRMWGL